MVWCHNQRAVLIALRSTEYLYSTVWDQGSKSDCGTKKELVKCWQSPVMVLCQPTPILIALRSTEYLYSTVGDQGSKRTLLTRGNTTVSSFRVSFVYTTSLCMSNANYCSSYRNVTCWQFALTLWQCCFRQNNTSYTLYLPTSDCVTSLSLATRQAMLHKETAPPPSPTPTIRGFVVLQFIHCRQSHSWELHFYYLQQIVCAWVLRQTR